MFTNMIRMIALTVFFGSAGQLLWAQQTEHEDNLTFAFQDQVSEASTAQNVLLKRVIELNISNATVEQALSVIAEELDLKLMYTEELLPKDTRVTIEHQRMTLYEALWEVLEGTDLQFGISSNRLLVVVKNPNANVQSAQEVVQQTITGTVIDAETGEALPGVNVIAGSSENTASPIGTTTDMDGNYQLEVPEEVTTLVFSYVGYQRLEVNIDGRSQIDVELNQDVQMLEDVVVIGYGTQEKSDITGSVASISSDDFNPGVNSSVDQLMQGATAGVQITQTTGEPGGGMSIRIRGASSINASNQPLYVIDGLPIDNSPLLPSISGNVGLGSDENPRNPLVALNPNDIESIEILKDASATAIYGARGANGVVLITTKKGQDGDVQVSYDGYMSTQSTAKKLDLLGTQEYIQFINGVSDLAGNGIVFSDSDINSIGEGTNWQNEIYRTAPATSHNLSVSGGNETSTYRVSLNYFNQEGLLKKSGVQKLIGRLNLDTDFAGGNGRMGININTSTINNDNSVSNTLYNEGAGPIQAAVEMDPTEPIFNEDGNYARSAFLTVNNPLSVLNGVSSVGKVNRTFGNVYFQYNLLENLSAKLDFGYDRQSNKLDLYNSTLTINGDANNGIANITTLDRTNVNLEYTMRYNKQLNESNSFDVLGGITYQEFNQELVSSTIRGFPTDQIKTNNLALGDTGLDDLSSNKEVNKLMSYLGRINYNLLDRYLLTASIRADGSSRFGENNRYGYFPSVALAWRLSEEEFIADFFSDLKLRTSWGITGNQEIGNFNYLSTFVPGPNAIYANEINSSLSPSRIPNPNLKWETTKQYNVGVDVGILEDRISGSVDYFVKNTEDMLINLPLPAASGYDSQLTNVGKMRNKGFELQINSANVSTSNFTWNTTFNFSSINSEVIDLGRVDEILTGGAIEDVPSVAIYRNGAPPAAYYGYEVTGIFRTDDDIAGSAQPNANPGEPIFRDVNGDGRISPDDQTIIGNPYPDFTFGMRNSFNYKNWSLDFFIQGQQGADLFNVALLRSLYPINFRSNRLREPSVNRWTPENQNTKWPSGVNPSSYGGGRANSLVVEDASYIRLQNVRISYNIPQNFISSATVYVTGQNLITITDYSGVNPEANALGRSDAKIDYDSYPLARTFLVGINLTF